MKNCDICANDVFRDSWRDTGVAPKAFTPPGARTRDTGNGQPAAPPDMEALIQSITDRVLAELK